MLYVGNHASYKIFQTCAMVRQCSTNALVDLIVSLRYLFSVSVTIDSTSLPQFASRIRLCSAQVFEIRIFLVKGDDLCTFIFCLVGSVCSLASIESVCNGSCILESVQVVSGEPISYMCDGCDCSSPATAVFCIGSNTLNASGPLCKCGGIVRVSGMNKHPFFCCAYSYFGLPCTELLHDCIQSLRLYRCGLSCC